MSIHSRPGLLRQLLAPSARRAVLTALGVWLVVVAVTFVVISRLDQPTGSAPPDAAQPVVGQVAVPGAGAAASAPDALPPLALALERALPPALAGVTGDALVARLRRLAARAPTALNLDRLGAAHQGVGDAAAARAAYRRALAVDPGDLGARVGLMLVDASRGRAGLARAARALGALAARHPSSQLVAFNQGLVAVYRRDRDTVLAAWRRAAALGPRTALGRTALGVVTALERREAPLPGGG
jgi:hypothetical protein